jgi:hypothetical protein
MAILQTRKIDRKVSKEVSVSGAISPSRRHDKLRLSAAGYCCWLEL